MSPSASNLTAEASPFDELSNEMARPFGAAATLAREFAASPATWLQHALAKADVGWISGEIRPPTPGVYERLFVDGVTVHKWDGETWWADGAAVPHWRQLGDYPCWRVCVRQQ